VLDYMPFDFPIGLLLKISLASARFPRFYTYRASCIKLAVNNNVTSFTSNRRDDSQLLPFTCYLSSLAMIELKLSSSSVAIYKDIYFSIDNSITF
jgi:hypothetical protein